LAPQRGVAAAARVPRPRCQYFSPRRSGGDRCVAANFCRRKGDENGCARAVPHRHFPPCWSGGGGDSCAVVNFCRRRSDDSGCARAAPHRHFFFFFFGGARENGGDKCAAVNVCRRRNDGSGCALHAPRPFIIFGLRGGSGGGCAYTMTRAPPTFPFLGARVVRRILPSRRRWRLLGCGCTASRTPPVSFFFSPNFQLARAATVAC